MKGNNIGYETLQSCLLEFNTQCLDRVAAPLQVTLYDDYGSSHCLLGIGYCVKHGRCRRQCCCPKPRAMVCTKATYDTVKSTRADSAFQGPACLRNVDSTAVAPLQPIEEDAASPSPLRRSQSGSSYLRCYPRSISCSSRLSIGPPELIFACYRHTSSRYRSYQKSPRRFSIAIANELKTAEEIDIISRSGISVSIPLSLRLVHGYPTIANLAKFTH